jgi:hypothetical protein
LDGLIEPVEAAEVTLVALLPVPCVELADPVPVCEPVPEAELVAPVLLGWPVPVPDVELMGVLVGAAPSDAVLVAPVGVALTGVGDDVPVGDSGALGSVVDVPGVPSVVGVEVGVDVTGVDVGLFGSVRLSGLPGP